jgi:hypothetical protein
MERKSELVERSKISFHMRSGVETKDFELYTVV